MGKKSLSVLLTICLIISLLPTLCLPALAAVTITVGAAGDYSSLSAALTNVENGSTVKLLENVEESVGISVSAGATVTIDGGGFTVTAPAGNGDNSIAFYLDGSGTIILKNITLKGGAVKGNYDSIGLKIKTAVP